MKLNDKDLDFLIQKGDKSISEKVYKRWNSIAHPLEGLGLLESSVADLALAQKNILPDISKRAVVVFCSDNGIVEEGVSQTGQEVTAIVAGNMCSGATSVCNMAKVAKADVIPVDMGMIKEVKGCIDLHVMRGTKNFLKEDAMTKEQLLEALSKGFNLAVELSKKGYKLFATGEMGIGNTTTSTAVACCLLDKEVTLMTGPGAGLSKAAVFHKAQVIEQAIKNRNVNKKDVLDVVAKVGGFDIAGMAGFFLGSAASHVPVVIDGFISALSALVASLLCESSLDYMIASHASSEPAFSFIMQKLEKSPIIYANMHLGEGCGAVSLFPLLDMALAVYKGMATFEDINVEAYKKL